MACPIHDVIQQKPANVVRRREEDHSSHGRERLEAPRLANRSCEAAKIGGARRDRTDDLLLAKQALSQLSYGPAPVMMKLGYPGIARNGGPGKI